MAAQKDFRTPTRSPLVLEALRCAGALRLISMPRQLYSAVARSKRAGIEHDDEHEHRFAEHEKSNTRGAWEGTPATKIREEPDLGRAGG